MESALSLKKTDYMSKLGHRAGYGAGEDAGDTAWNAEQLRIITDCVESGLRNFYHCGYAWSFLKPYRTLTLASGKQVVALPDDFAGIEGQITVSDSVNGYYRPSATVSPAQIDRMYANGQQTNTGWPLAAAVRAVKAMHAGKGQRSELYVFPTADAAYTLRIEYYMLPGMPMGTEEYAYGGAEHVETILQSCMAVLETRWQQIFDGPQSILFDRKLSESKMMDQRKKPQYMGRNSDRSDEQCQMTLPLAPIMINGVDYTGG